MSVTAVTSSFGPRVSFAPWSIQARVFVSIRLYASEAPNEAFCALSFSALAPADEPKKPLSSPSEVFAFGRMSALTQLSRSPPLLDPGSDKS